MRKRLVALAVLLALIIAACSTTNIAPEANPIFGDDDLDAAPAVSGLSDVGADLAAGAIPATTGELARNLAADAAAIGLGLGTQASELVNTGGFLAYVEHKGNRYSVRLDGLGNTGAAGSNGDRILYRGRRPIQSVAVSNDGGFVAFLAESRSGDNDLYLLDLSGDTLGAPNALQVVDTDADEQDISMSADGSVLTWQGETANGPSLAWLNLASSQFVELDSALFGALFGVPFYAVEPSLSGNGDSVAFVDPSGLFPPLFGFPPLPLINTLDFIVTGGTLTALNLNLLIIGEQLETPSLDYAANNILHKDVLGGVPVLSIFNIPNGSFLDLLADVVVDHPYLAADGVHLTFAFEGVRYLGNDESVFEALSGPASASASATYWAKGNFTSYGGTNSDGPFVRADSGDGIDEAGRTVFYHAFEFTSPKTAFYEILSVQDYDGFLTLYQGSFDPDNADANVVANNDDFGSGFDGTTGTSRIVAELKKNTTYVIVTSACGAAGTGCGPDQGNFENTISDGAPPPVPPTVLPAPDNSRFNITLRFWNASFTAAEEAVFTVATDRWSEAIVDDVENIPGFELTEDQTTAGAPGIVGELDDVVIDAAKVPIDGPGGVLARAGARFVRAGGPDDFITTYGLMEFDEAEFAPGGFYSDIDAFAAVILHEMGHVLGISRAFWGPKGFLVGNRPASEGCSDVSQGDNPRYIGPNGVDAWVNFYGASSPDIPVANTNGCGTADSHWREIFLDDELMTGFAEGGGEPLSRVTIGALDDLGYGVDYDAADAWMIPALPRLEQTAPGSVVYAVETDFGVSFTGATLGEVTAPVTAVDLSLGDPAASTSGCEAADFAGFPAGNIALIQRGACTFALKATNALDAGASAVLIFNQGTPGRTGIFSGTFGGPIDIVAVPLTFALGADLAGIAGLEMLVDTDPSDSGSLRAQALADLEWDRAEVLLPIIGAIDVNGNVIPFDR